MTTFTSVSSSGKFHAFRLRPGDDLAEGIQRYAVEHNIKAGAMVTCVGSLKRVHLRFANQDTGVVAEGYHEIVSMVGTFSNESFHLHIAVSDSSGNTTGGHLLTGNLVYTTAEIVVAELTDAAFNREHDPESGYRELAVSKRTFS